MTVSPTDARMPCVFDGLLAADFLAAGFLAADFFAAGFLAAAFFAAGFLAADFFAAGFFAADFLAAPVLLVRVAMGFPLVLAQAKLD
jgi:hypothetical protein